MAIVKQYNERKKKEKAHNNKWSENVVDVRRKTNRDAYTPSTLILNTPKKKKYINK